MIGSSPPKKILFATDLSCRCDRALDRAALLARQWNAHLVIAHVLETPDSVPNLSREEDLPSWRCPPDRTTAAQARILRDLQIDFDDFSLRVEPGEPAKVINDIALAEGCGLIVTGVARDEPLGRYFLGTTVNRLVHRATAPILIVKERPRPYHEIVVATDLSPLSAYGLKTAANLFPDAALTLLYAFETPTHYWDRTRYRDQTRRAEEDACGEFVTQASLPPEQRRRLKVLAEPGSAEVLIRTYMTDRNVNLVALATHGRTGVLDVLIGSTAKLIADASPGDVLLVPARGAKAA
jgi:nucleotide-binding universal stress UspA family protein